MIRTISKKIIVSLLIKFPFMLREKWESYYKISNMFFFPILNDSCYFT